MAGVEVEGTPRRAGRESCQGRPSCCGSQTRFRPGIVRSVRVTLHDRGAGSKTRAQRPRRARSRRARSPAHGACGDRGGREIQRTAPAAGDCSSRGCLLALAPRGRSSVARGATPGNVTQSYQAPTGRTNAPSILRIWLRTQRSLRSRRHAWRRSRAIRPGASEMRRNARRQRDRPRAGRPRRG